MFIALCRTCGGVRGLNAAADEMSRRLDIPVDEVQRVLDGRNHTRTAEETRHTLALAATFVAAGGHWPHSAPVEPAPEPGPFRRLGRVLIGR